MKPTLNRNQSKEGKAVGYCYGCWSSNPRTLIVFLLRGCT